MPSRFPSEPCPCRGRRPCRRCRGRTAPGGRSGDESQSWRWDGAAAMDAYCVLDRERLAVRLASQPDVVGEPGFWAWIEGLPEGCRSLAVLTVTPDGLLIVRTESSVMADRAFAWLARICGDLLLTERGEVLRLGSVAELDRPHRGPGAVR